MKEKIITAAAYIRVSTDRQEELSPAAQKRELLKYAKSHNITIITFFRDDGISGRKAERRPEFQKMIAAAKSPDHPYDCILVWKYSRFARNQEESIVYKSLLRRNSVDVISITEPLVDGPFASLIERIIEWMDEYYSIRLAGDVRRGMTEKALRGGYQSKPPIGYRMNKETHVPEIYEPDAVIVRTAFRLCQEGRTLTTIARTLNDQGYRTSRGNRFETRTVLYMLSNPFYIGMVRWNRARHGSYSLNDEKEIITAEGVHEPLISKEDFEKVQVITSRHAPGHTGQRRRKSETLYKHYLCGLIKCPICGANLAYHNCSSYPYFSCWKYAKGMHEGGANINYQRCEEALQDSLKSIIRAGVKEVSFHPDQKPVAHDTEQLLACRKAITRLEGKERRIREAYIEGIDTKEEYRENKLLIQKERERLEQLIRQEEQSLPGMPDIQTAEEYIQRIKDILVIVQNPDVATLEKHKALETVLKYMEYHRDTDSFDFYYLHS